MTTSAAITMILTMVIVTSLTSYFFSRILRPKRKETTDSESEGNDAKH